MILPADVWGSRRIQTRREDREWSRLILWSRHAYRIRGRKPINPLNFQFLPFLIRKQKKPKKIARATSYPSLSQWTTDGILPIGERVLLSQRDRTTQHLTHPGGLDEMMRPVPRIDQRRSSRGVIEGGTITTTFQRDLQVTVIQSDTSHLTFPPGPG